MNNTRKSELVAYLKKLGHQFSQAAEVAPELFSEKAEEIQKELELVIDETDKRDIFVPLVGGFSTGKSTALNSLLGRDILPEKVSPETAIPAELHFDTDERIMALSVNGDWSQHEITALADLSGEANQYQVVRIFLNSPVLQEIHPLVLVDMPGFDSGLDQHNSAILRYITSGALYLYMVNAKAGTVSRQDVRRIEEILDLGRSIQVFLTMTDIASPVELEETYEYVSEHIAMVTGESGVGKINKDDVAPLLAAVKSADVSVLFDGMALPKVKNLYFDALGQVNTAIKVLSSDKNSRQQAITDAELSLKKVEAERERLLTDVRSGSVSTKCELIIRKLEQALHSSIDELAAQAKIGESGLSKAVSGLVRATLSVEIQALIRKSTTDIAYQFSGEVNLTGLSLAPDGNDWMSNLISVIETEAMDALTGIEAKEKEEKNKQKDGNPMGKVIGSLGSLAILIPHPVLRIIFAILPGIIGELLGSVRSNNEADKYRQAIASQVIPGVISQVRPQVLESLNSVEGEIIRVISEQVESKVSSQKALYDEVAKCSEAEIQALQESQGLLKNIRQAMTESAQGVVV
jgi:hypothetical protein